MNKYARFEEIPSVTLKDIKKKMLMKDGPKDGRMDGQRENSIPTHKYSLQGCNKATSIKKGCRVAKKLTRSRPNN